MTQLGETPVTHDEMLAMRREISDHKERAHRRMLVLYIVLIAGIVFFLFLQTRSDHQDQLDNQKFRESVVETCRVAARNTDHLNHLIDAVIERAKSAPDLTPAERAKFVSLYQGAKGDIPSCPPA
jgi:uncharacterized protein HemX